MRKKLWMKILAVCICVAMLPLQALAEEQETTAVESVETAEVQEQEEPSSTEGQEDVEAETPENDDPGNGRLRGYIQDEFYGPVSKARSAEIQHAAKFDGYTIENGIDVSKFNGTIDWAKVKAAGIQFAIIQVAFRGYGTSGSLNYDANAFENIENAIAAGVSVGVYIFSQATTTAEAEEEAQFILDAISRYNITLPVVMDFEYANDSSGNLVGRLYNANLSKDAATNVCLAFCNKVKRAGYTPMVYANKDMLTNHLNASSISSSYPIWLAHYTTATDYTGDYNYWQYSATGTVNGISGNVDLDVRYINNEENNGSGSTTEPSDSELTYTDYRTTTDVNYRTGPGTSYSLAGTLPSGTTIRVEDGYSASANGYTWYRFKMNSQNYYIASAYVTKVTDTLSTPTLGSAKYSSDAVTVTWNQVSGASGYYVYRKLSGGSWSKIATVTSGSTVSYKDSSSLTAGKTYVYTVRAYAGSTISGYDSTGVSVSIPDKTYTPYKTTDSVNYRTGPGTSYSKSGTLSSGTIIEVEDGYSKSANGYTWYRFKLNSKEYYVASSYIKKLTLSKPTLVSATYSSGAVTFKWKKVTDSKGYYIYRKESGGSWKKIKTITSGSTVSYKDSSSLTSGKTYVYTARAYYGNVMSGYNSGLRVKIPGVTYVKYNTTTGVNYRTGPGTSYSKAGTLAAGTTIQVEKGYSKTANGYTWYRFKMNSKNYYIASKYVKKV